VQSRGLEALMGVEKSQCCLREMRYHTMWT